MPSDDPLQRYIDAGMAFTDLTRRKAEEIVSDLVRNGDFQTDEARARVEELVERGRRSTEAIVATVRSEVSRQLGALGISSLEDLADQVATVLGRSGPAPEKAGSEKAPAKKAAAKKAPAKKAAAKKAQAKKAPTKKAQAKKAATGPVLPAEERAAGPAPGADPGPAGSAD